jgi:hypothetical protein
LDKTGAMRAGTLDGGSNNLRIGRDADLSALLDGTIDDVRIYNRALSADEIKRLYNMGR